MSANHEKNACKNGHPELELGGKKWFSELRAWLGLAYYIA